jgi:O-antigen/teichoic acid export membrane protein
MASRAPTTKGRGDHSDRFDRSNPPLAVVAGGCLPFTDSQSAIAFMRSMRSVAGDILAHPGAAAARLSAVARLRARLGAAGSGGVVLGARLGGAALAYAVQIVAARLLGQDGFGIYALALVWLTLLGHLSTFGIGQAMCRCIAAGLATGDRAGVRGLLRFGLGFVVAVGLVVCAVIWLAIGFAPSLVGSDYLWPILLAACAVPILALQDALEAAARAFDRPLLGIGPAYVARHAATLALLGGLAGLHLSPSPAMAVAVAVAGMLVGIALQIVLLARHVRSVVPPGSARYDIHAWLRIALPVALVDGTEALLLNADVVLLGLFCPPEAVAAYFAASRLAQILDYVRYAASAATAQRFAAQWATGRRDDLRRLIAQATLGAGGLALIGALVLVGGGRWLLGLFGPGFEEALPVLPILAAGFVVSILLGPGEDVLTMLGEERACAVVYALALVAALALAFALVPAFGIVGAAIASAAAAILRAAGLAAAAWIRLGLLIPLGLSRTQRDA